MTTLIYPKISLINATKIIEYLNTIPNQRAYFKAVKGEVHIILEDDYTIIQ